MIAVKEAQDFPHIFQEIDEVFASHGILAGGLSSYVLRPGQIEMAKLVAETLEDKRILAVEAGTGTGKTLAYLVPSIIWSWENDSRVVISTNTINLQDQIWNQDIPMLQKLLPYQFSAVRLKGRSNYLCLRKWYGGQQLALGDLVSGEFFRRVEEWLSTTGTGDKSELNLTSLEENLWQRYSSEDYSCHGMKCRWGQDCFLRRMRAAAGRANLILVNHSLLLTDAGGGFGILPEFSALVVDEAHNLNAAAVSQFSLSLAQGELLEVYNLSGKIPQLVKPYLRGNQDSAGRVQEQVQSLQDSRSGCFKALSQVFESGARYLRENSGKQQLRLQFEHHQEYLDNLFGRCRELLQSLTGIKESMDLLEGTLEGLQENDEFRQLYSAVDSARKKLMTLSQYDEQEQVLWLEELGGGQGVCIRSAPLDPGNILSQLLYSRLDSVVLTSATLRLRNSFEYFSRELGLFLSEDVLYENVLPAFDFSSQARIFVAGDLPEPAWKNDGAWVEACGEALARLARSCSGNVLALFTSHKHLLQTNERLRDRLAGEGIRVLAHDIDGDRYSLVQAMKTGRKTLLLGTGSFWEGIDVPGDCLQCVVICKLPFPVPDSPLFEAKVERARKQGINPFTSIFLPICTARLLQGIGRLIRSEGDFGFAVILDSRLVSKGYSAFILDSLPDTPLVMETGDICCEIEEMISNRKKSPLTQDANTMIGD